MESRKHVIALGAGLVGSAMIRDLLREQEFTVTAVDIDPRKLDRLGEHAGLEKRCGDIREAGFLDQLWAVDGFILNAVPGHLGFGLLRQAVERGRALVDICFAPEDPLSLQELALKTGSRAIVDMGVAPGMSNLLSGCAAREMDEMHSLRILVGGLPRERVKPFEYKAGFSPVDVIEEYTRPARFVEGGRLVTREALSGVERVDIAGLGSLEAFNSDGLRTLLSTIEAPDMIEKTLRYPGHAEMMRLFRDTGLFDEKPLRLGDTPVVPRELTSALLFRHWEMREGDEDLTVMRVMAEGRKDHRRVIFAAALFDEYDRELGVHSMARTTGYAATSALRLLASGRLGLKGIIPPEALGRKAEYSTFMLEDQQRRGIAYHITLEREEDWSSGECGG
ncbi:MAG TPA: saccharopine dehydrogenase C-terminal domain-containing protein [Bacteroidales bacterium]|nr:saccharopine dehydrogenase C-terminal domain-containing protein [Bacteroidales bacterium]